MDTRNGTILSESELIGEYGADYVDSPGYRYIKVNESDMTKKQRMLRKVSIHDNRSILGKQRVRARIQLRTHIKNK